MLASFILFHYLDVPTQFTTGYDSPVIIYSGELPSQFSHPSTTLSATQPPYSFDQRTLPPGEDHQPTFGLSGGDLL